MSKVVIVQLEWKYTPSNYFEEPISISDEGYTLDISEGSAVAKIEPTAFDKNSEISGDLTAVIKNRLQAVQLMTHKEFLLSKPSRIDLREDGKRNIFLNVDSMTIKISTGTVDIIIKDKDGNVISDSKRTRLDKQNWLALAINKHRPSDKTLDKILNSYGMSVNEPGNELVRLYEIRDALTKYIDNHVYTIKDLGISKSEWDTIGKIANRPDLKQGRHSGKATGNLRNATHSELELARKAIFNLIEKYLMHLERK